MLKLVERCRTLVNLIRRKDPEIFILLSLFGVKVNFLFIFGSFVDRVKGLVTSGITV